jgi:hypothetical protein
MSAARPFLTKERIMRKWLFLSAAILPVALVAALAQAPAGDKKLAIPPIKPAIKPAVKPAVKTGHGLQNSLAKSRVVKVTVYPNSALVTREVDVPAGAGLVELVVSGLPEQVQNSSLYSEGGDGIRVLSTRYRTRPVFEDTREDVRKWQDEQKKLMLAAQKIQADIETLNKNMLSLNKLESFTEKATVLSSDKGALNGDAAITMVKYVMEQRDEKAKELVALQQQLSENKERAAYVASKLSEVTAGSTHTERDAIIVVDREQGGGTVRLNYLVGAVSWQPQYKLRAGGVKEPVQVDYLASLKQQTGEEWSHVDLTLSTAQPMLNAAPPELHELEVAVVARASLPGGVAGGQAGGRPGLPSGGGFGGMAPPIAAPAPMDLAKKAQELREKAQLNSTMIKKDAVAGLQLNQAAAYEQTRDLMKSKEELVVEGRVQRKEPASANEGPSVTYHLKARLTVPSRNDEQVVEIAKLTFEPHYYYKAVPVLAQHVYRLADLTNKSGVVLLPGEATMYQGSDFVGRMTMPLVAVGEEFTAGFGVDPQLQVQRQMMDKERSMKGGNQVMTYKYRILVSSYKSEPVRLQLWDRLPHAETEAAGITLVKASPDLSKDALYERESRPHNLLRWDLDVEPNTSGEKATPITYEFRLELDRNLAISGLLVR